MQHLPKNICIDFFLKTLIIKQPHNLGIFIPKSEDNSAKNYYMGGGRKTLACIQMAIKSQTSPC